MYYPRLGYGYSVAHYQDSFFQVASSCPEKLFKSLYITGIIFRFMQPKEQFSGHDYRHVDLNLALQPIFYFSVLSKERDDYICIKQIPTNLLGQLLRTLLQ